MTTTNKEPDWHALADQYARDLLRFQARYIPLLMGAIEALEEYGQHTARCSWDTRGDAESVCDCGLHEALDRLRKP